MAEPAIHRAAATGFSRAADAYERGRPSFPADAVAWLVDDLGVGAGRTILELGAGTGKLTRLLAGRGARVVAVEPVAEMRASLAALEGVEPLDAVAETVPLDDGSVDGAVGAQAFHWFDNTRVAEELARLLPAGGPVALVWNVRDESVPWVADLTALLEPYRGDTPSHRSMAWKEAWDADPRFAPLGVETFAYVHATTAEGVRDRVASISFVAALDDTTREALLDRVAAIVPLGDTVAFPYRTEVWHTRRQA